MITRRMRIQALADRLAGHKTSFTSDDFSGVLRSCWLILDKVPLDEAMGPINALLKNSPEGDQLMEEIRRTKPGTKLGQLPSLAEISDTLSPVEWVWKGWVPRGMISILIAAPGTGKSLVALDLARRIIHNEGFPDGSPVPNPGRPVFYLDAEACPQIINQRAKSWNMNLKLLYLKEPEKGGWIDLNNLSQRDELIEQVSAISPELLIIDSYANITTRGENDVEAVRELLLWLNFFASDFNLGLLIIHHMRKMNYTNMFNEFHVFDSRGSTHIPAMGRTVIGLNVIRTGPEFNRNGPRRIEVGKSNGSFVPTPLGFELQSIEPDGVALRWGPAPKPYFEPSQIDKCKEWMLDLLASRSEPIKPSEIIRLAVEQGYNERMVYRARGALGSKIADSLGRQNPENGWLLSDE